MQKVDNKERCTIKTMSSDEKKRVSLEPCMNVLSSAVKETKRKINKRQIQCILQNTINEKFVTEAKINKVQVVISEPCVSLLLIIRA